MEKEVNILGIRGIPAAHGGFETFAGHLAPYLRDRGWKVNVYCQIDPDREGNLRPDYEDDWEGIRRIHLGSRGSGSRGSVVFDWRCVQHVRRMPGVDLVLGYNTAVFTTLQRIWGRRVVMNMDGIEWKRAKWPTVIKAWFYLNEFIGYRLANVAIADHPEIRAHLQRHGSHPNVQVIPYGARAIKSASPEALRNLDLQPGGYLVSIARIEPENSILEVVRAFSSVSRGYRLVVLGNLARGNAYHEAVRSAGSEEVLFPGAIYDSKVVEALRFYALAYVHGHQVGGTNPSLVEALGAGNAVIAHDNRFNRWVAGDGQTYFHGEADLLKIFEELPTHASALKTARRLATERHASMFTLDSVHKAYEAVLEGVVPTTEALISAKHVSALRN